MINLYKKTEKSLENLNGIKEIKSIEELNKPFLLCISAQDNNDKSLYGIIREGAQAARVYTSQEIAAGFKIDEMPVDFLGVRFKSDDKYSNNYEEITDKVIYPYLMQTGKRNMDEIINQARKMNFMTYCDGTETYCGIEKQLEERLKSDSFSEEDITKIISEMSLVAIGTMVDTSDLKANTVTIIDVNDDEIETTHTNDFKKVLEKYEKKGIAGTLKNNNYVYCYEGTGNHDLKEYFKDESLAKPVLSGVLSHSLESSILNVPRNYENKIIEYSNDTLSSKDLLNKLDNQLSYNGTQKYSNEEALLRQSLDNSYKELAKTRKQLDSAIKEIERKDNSLSSTIENIGKFSSDTTYEQILIASGLYQSSDDIDVFSLPSDKQIRESYENTINLH